MTDDPAPPSRANAVEVPMPSNFLKTGFLLLVLTAILVATGALIGGESGMVIAFVASLAMNLFSLWNSDKIVLRMFKAQQVDAQSAPDLTELIAALAARAGLPMPRVFVIESDQPNAFATGRGPSTASVAVSTGLLRMLSREELAGVMAHELAHISNRDTLTMTVAASLGGAVSFLANMLQFRMIFGGGRANSARGGMLGTLVAMFVAPLAAMLVQMAISRSREYQADRIGAEICGNPLWLASALEKIQAYVRQIRNPTAEAIPAAAHLFIINPLTGRGMDSLFSTHPSTENRIAELMKFAAERGALRDGGASAPPAGPLAGPRGPWSS